MRAATDLSRFSAVRRWITITMLVTAAQAHHSEITPVATHGRLHPVSVCAHSKAAPPAKDRNGCMPWLAEPPTPATPGTVAPDAALLHPSRLHPRRRWRGPARGDHRRHRPPRSDGPRERPRKA